MKLKKADKVKITSGKDAGKEGAVEKVFPAVGKVIVPGVNIFKRHQKPRGEGQKGGIMEYPRPLAISKVALICPKCKQVTRIGYKITNKEKVRICRKCNQEI